MVDKAKPEGVKKRTVAAVPLPGANRRAMEHMSLDQGDSDHTKPQVAAAAAASTPALIAEEDPAYSRLRPDVVLRGTARATRVSRRNAEILIESEPEFIFSNQAILYYHNRWELQELEVPSRVLTSLQDVGRKVL